ncbi:capsule assembly Wzi family protein [candidate division KSB1 bacterium]
MRKKVTGILCIFFTAALTSVATAQSVYVPLSYSVYDYIDRFEAKGVLRSALNGIKPLSRAEVASLISIIDEAYRDGYALSEVETDQLRYYKQEFSEELEMHNSSVSVESIEYPGWFERVLSTVPGSYYRNKRNLFSFQNDDFTLFIDPVLNQDNSIDDIDSLETAGKVYRYSSGFHIRGSLGDNLGFLLDVRNTREWGSRDYPDLPGLTAPSLGWIRNMDTHQYHDETIGYVVWRVSPLEFEIGKDLNRWGPGFHGTLLLSGKSTSYDMVKLTFRTGRVKYVHLLGFLTAYPRIVESLTGEGETQKVKYASKYISAHRLEFNLFRGVDIGLHEAVIHGQRPLEPAYLNPVMFLRSAEHYLGDQDNALMGADIELYFVDNWKWYGELLIDDIMTTRLGTKWYGNKLGFLAGSLWIDPGGLSNTSLRFEYARIKPYVYTHRFPVNVYKHFNTGFGHPVGPNADEWFFRADRFFTRRMNVSLEYSYSRHGANPSGVNVGGDIDMPHAGGVDADYIGFLESDVEKQQSLQFGFSYEAFRNLFLTGYFSLRSGDNFRIKGLDGQDYDSQRFFFAIRMNY